MRRTGNVNANKTYNPQNAKPQIPLDVDEVDAVLEKFIKQKYDQRVFSGGNPRPAMRNNTGNTSSTRSSDEQPPPLPPKPLKRFGFGFRSASAALPTSSGSTASSPRSPDGFNSPPLPARANKQSRVFGASVGGTGDDLESKLSQLRDMGFADEKRNASVLKGHGGKLEKTIESLVRLGEGSTPVSRSRTPHSRTTEPRHPTQPENPTPAVKEGSAPLAGSDEDVAVSSPDFSSRGFSPSNPFQGQAQNTPYNSSGAPSQQLLTSTQPLEQAFAHMQVAQTPLFPNATGGYPSQPPLVQDPRAQTMTPPIPQIPVQYSSTNPYTSPIHNQSSKFNPFFASQRTQQQPTANPNLYQPSLNPQADLQAYKPFQQSSQILPQLQPTPIHVASPAMISPVSSPSATHQPIPDLQQYPQPYPHQQQQQINLFISPQNPSVNPAQHQLFPQQQQQQQSVFGLLSTQPLQSPAVGRLDKSSIMALYNYPQLAPPRLEEGSAAAQEQQQGVPAQAASPAVKQPQRSVTMPAQIMSGSRNPFQSTTTQPPPNRVVTGGPGRHMSQESVDVGGYQTGRHSPDAFASLSARYMR